MESIKVTKGKVKRMVVIKWFINLVKEKETPTTNIFSKGKGNPNNEHIYKGKGNPNNEHI